MVSKVPKTGPLPILSGTFPESKLALCQVLKEQRVIDPETPLTGCPLKKSWPMPETLTPKDVCHCVVKVGGVGLRL